MNQPINDQSTAAYESLSALVDGALDRSETAFLLRRLEHDPALRSCYGRYHLIGDCLRRQMVATPAPAALAERIRQAIAAERRPVRALPWRAGMQWAAGVFTAALVAAGAFWYVQPPQADAPGALAAGDAEVTASGVRVDDLRRQLPLLPVSARWSRPLGGEFAPQPDPEAWQQAPATPSGYPAGQYIIVLQRQTPAAGGPPPRVTGDPANQP
jgi:hypothetical protein